jgi:hypothetical protein
MVNALKGAVSSYNRMYVVLGTFTVFLLIYAGLSKYLGSDKEIAAPLMHAVASLAGLYVAHRAGRRRGWHEVHNKARSAVKKHLGDDPRYKEVDEALSNLLTDMEAD